MVVILPDVKKWYYKDYVVKVVNAYKYLVGGFSTRLSFLIPLKARKRKQSRLLLKYSKLYGCLAMFLRIFF